LEIAGLVLIGVSILALSGSTSWPGYWAAIPVVGTSLILLAAPTSLWSSNPASQAIGKWSYSIYLWHWPVFVASHYFDWKQTVVSQISLILVSVGLGYLSYRFIEEPCRHSAFAKTLNWRKAGVMALPVVMLGIVGIATKGLPARLPSAVAAIEADPAHLRGNPAVLCEQTQRMHGLNACLMGNASVPPAVAVLGDSHAGALLYAVKRAATDSDIRVLALLSAACPPIEDIQGIAGIPGEGCKRYVASSLAALDELDSIRSVVLIARWSVYVEGYSEKAGGPYALFDRNGMRETSARRQEYRHRLVNSLCHMAKRRTVYVVLPLPEHSKNIPREMARQLITDSDKDFPVVSIAEYDRRNAVVLESLKEASEICGIRLLDPRPYLRGETGYMGAVNGRPAYYDDDHLNEYGNTLIFGMLDRVEEFGTRRLR